MHTRVVNIRHEPYDVYIGRPGVWGNPFTEEEYGRAEAIRLHRAWVERRLEREPGLLYEIIALKGLTLGCFCAPLPCHGDTLAALADRAA